jgi:hypothetical protein
MGFIDKNTIATNGNLIMPEWELISFWSFNVSYAYGLGKNTLRSFKSDFRYSKDIVYNNFPWPTRAKRKTNKSI